MLFHIECYDDPTMPMCGESGTNMMLVTSPNCSYDVCAKCCDLYDARQAPQKSKIASLIEWVDSGEAEDDLTYLRGEVEFIRTYGGDANRKHLCSMLVDMILFTPTYTDNKVMCIKLKQYVDFVKSQRPVTPGDLSLARKHLMSEGFNINPSGGTYFDGNFLLMESSSSIDVNLDAVTAEIKAWVAAQDEEWLKTIITHDGTYKYYENRNKDAFMALDIEGFSPYSNHKNADVADMVMSWASPTGRLASSEPEQQDLKTREKLGPPILLDMGLGSLEHRILAAYGDGRSCFDHAILARHKSSTVVVGTEGNEYVVHDPDPGVYDIEDLIKLGTLVDSKPEKKIETQGAYNPKDRLLTFLPILLAMGA